MRVLRIVFLGAIFAVFAISAKAQVGPGVESGAPAYGRFSGSDFDQVNLLNGNLHLDIPVSTVKERGRTFSVHFYFDPLSWNLTYHKEALINGVNPSWWGVTINNGGSLYLSSPLYWNVVGPIQPATLTCTGTQQQYSVNTGFALVGPDNTEHPLPLRQEIGPNGCYGSTLSGPTIDGTGMTYNLSTNVITFPDGTSITHNSNESSLEDANGNLITTSYPGAVFADMLGRPLMTSTQGPNVAFTSPMGTNCGNSAQYTLYNVTDTNGVQQTYRIDYQCIDYKSDMCPLAATQNFQPCFEETGYMQVAKTLTLPNGKTYTFTFNNDTPGQLAEVGLPTGGYITYTYADSYYPQEYAGLPYNYSGRQGVTSRTVHENGNTYQWTYSGIGTSNATTTVTDPDGNQQVHTYSYIADGNGHESATMYEQSVIYKDSSGNVLRTVAENYTGDLDTISSTIADGRISSVTTTLDNGLVSQKQTDYETFQYNSYCPSGGSCMATGTRMNPTEVRDYDYGNGSPGPLLRRTDYTYLHNNPTNGSTYTALNIVNKVASVTVYNGSGNQMSQVQNEYDNYTAGISASGAIQHDSSRGNNYTTRGNLTAVSHWRNTDGAMLTSRNQYDDAGNMLSTTDPKGNATQYSYADSWASQTGGNACAPASGQTAAYLTKITNALAQITAHTYYSCSGLVASTTDPNSQTD